MSPSKSHIIRDPVHGVITLTETEKRILDTPPMQRLRNVRQLALAHLTYPGAHHTRFEHCLGTLYLADRAAQALDLPADLRASLRLAGLLHDVGHLPFSHDSDEVVRKRLGDHEARGIALVRSSPLSDILSESDSPRTVSDYMVGKSWGQLIAGDVGADRIDYLLRDAHYTGVAYGLVDWQRILTTLVWDKGAPALASNGLEAAESLILARFAMFHTVYYHHSVRIARLMLQSALRAALADGSFDWAAAQREGDSQLLERLRAVPPAAGMVERVLERRLYKRAAVVPWKSLSEKARKRVADGSLLRELSESAGVAVLADLPGHFISTPKIPVLLDGGARPLGEASPILASLRHAAAERATLLIAAPEEKVAVVAKQLKKAL